MELNLKNVNITKVTKEEILKRVSAYDIFAYYLGYSPELGRCYSSPFRKDRNPSFNVYKPRLLDYRFRDFGNGYNGDCFEFVSNLHCLSFWDTLNKINKDMHLNILSNHTQIDNIAQKIPIIQKRKTRIEIVEKPFKKVDLDFWKQFGITLDTLIKYKVCPCNRVSIYRNDNLILTLDYKESDPLYLYKIQDKVKIYRPFVDIYRFITNASEEYIQGLEQLPDKGELLIITKSLKDIMSLSELGYFSISPQSESVVISGELIKHLYTRFDNIILLYDCDRAGYKYSELLSISHNIPRIFIQNDYCILKSNKDSDITDISGYIKEYGINKAEMLMNKIING